MNITVATNINGQGGVATVLKGYQESGFLENNNITLLASHKRGGKTSLILVYVVCLVRLVWYHLFYNVGVVHIHMASRGSYKRKSFILRLCNKLGSKTLLHLHGAEFQEFYSNECDLLKKQHIAETFKLANCTIVLSSQWKRWLEETFGDTLNVKVVYNAVSKLELKNSDREEKCIAFLGQIGKRKGVFDLINSFPKVLSKHPGAKLVLAGDGELEEAKKLINTLGLTNSVTLLGWVSGQKKLDVLAKASVYCLPSYNEGFPMGVLEAMSAKVPVISTYAGGIPDAITNDKDGLLINAGDSEQLAGAICKLFEDPALSEYFTVNALNKFEQNFSFAAINPQLENIYRELLQK